MEKSLFFLHLLLGLTTIPLSAQSSFNPKLLYIGLAASYPWGFVATEGGYNQNGWGGSLSFNGMWSSATNAPFDYHGGGFFSSNNVHDFTLLASIRVLKEWPSPLKYLKFGVEAGPALVHTFIADNFQRKPGWQLFASNYPFGKVKENSIGISLRGKIEWQVGDWSGYPLNPGQMKI